MADPKIRYDILANAQGVGVEQLASELEKLDETIDPALAERARALADELRRMGREQQAAETFVRLKTATDETARELEQAQQAAQRLSAEIAQAGPPTRAQTGQMEKLRDAVRGAKERLVEQRTALDDARSGLTALGVPTEGLARRQAELRTALADTRAQIRGLGSEGQNLQAFSALATQTDAAADASFRADRAVEDFRASLGNAAAPTQTQARRLGELAEAARQARLAYIQAAQAQDQQAQALRAAGVDISRITAAQARARAETSAAAQAAREAAAASALQGRAAATAAETQARAATTVRTGLEGIAGQLRTLQQLAGAALGGQLLGGLAGDLARTADQYTNLSSRIRLVTGDGEEFDRAFEGVFDVAQRTGSAVESTGTLFTRLAQAGRDAGLGAREAADQALALTETINQAVQVSGSGAQASDAAITQLIQGLQSGVLRGEEFNSVMEQAPRLARALADGLGVTTGELRKLANQGQLSSAAVIEALRGQAASIRSEFEQLAPTVGRAVQNLSTNWTRYIGEVDKASGISSAAASAINALAGNLDTLGTVLFSAGKAALAYQAVKLALSFGEQARAAQVQAAAIATSTTALVANTGAARANASAHAAGAAAMSGASAAASASTGILATMAGVLRALPVVALVTVLTNLREIGTVIGETAAKWLGYGDAVEKAEQALREEETRARASARAKDEWAQAAKRAADEAAGLTDEVKVLVGEFESARQKGEDVAASLDKLTKAFDIGSLDGIRDAGLALAELARRGSLSAEQVRQAWAQALDGRDLVAFEAEARAAFAGAADGAELLAQALEGSVAEALRRTGADLTELTTGISAGARSAINDFDTLTNNLETLRRQGVDTGEALRRSLERATDASNTVRALEQVIERWEELGRTGQITGDQLADGLEKARRKLDEIKPGVNSLEEAFRQLGLRAPAELQKVADANKRAFDTIRNDATTTLAQKQEAFRRYAQSAIEANGGVISGELRLQAEILKVELAATKAGGAYERAMGGAERSVSRVGDATRQARSELEELIDLQRQVDGNSDNSQAGPAGIGETGRGVQSAADRNADTTREISAADAIRQALNRAGADNGGLQSLEAKRAAGVLTKEDLGTAVAAFEAAKTNLQIMQENATAFSQNGVRSVNEEYTRARRILEQLRSEGINASGAIGANVPGGLLTIPRPTPSQASQAAAAAAPAAPARTVRLTLDIGNRSATVDTTEESARQFVDLINEAKRQAGLA